MRGARGDPVANRTRQGRPRTDRRCDVRRRRERSPDGSRRRYRQEERLDRPREPLPTRVEGLPELPPEYHARLDRGIDELGLTLDAAARGAIDGHVRLLLSWNDAINLTSIRDAPAIAVRHVLDSLTAAAPLRERGVTELADLGSGGGFPGLPLAVAIPATRTLLVESIAKKARFLETVIAATGVGERAAVHAARAEELAADGRERERWPAVTARAVGDLAELVELSFPLLRPAGVLVAWKRGDIGAELRSAGRAIATLGGGDVDVLEARPTGLEGHVLVVVTKLRPTPDGYPRDPAVRRRRGW